jgi:hypothetical protein
MSHICPMRSRRRENVAPKVVHDPFLPATSQFTAGIRQIAAAFTPCLQQSRAEGRSRPFPAVAIFAAAFHAGVRRVPTPFLLVSPVPRGSCCRLSSRTSSNHRPVRAPHCRQLPSPSFPSHHLPFS